ncbi:glycosyltransferase [Inediibacterium massiliense]|uniref:glycosyltransferase n=1 Tax=Inediibacterium massiliense TaxID=1658111 RepID=UPI0006B4F3DB|nr:glycosyltransferase [Inediibacterium massiliense]
MDNGFCMVVSKYRIYQGIVLIESLFENIESPQVFVLCMDHEGYEILSNYKKNNIKVISIDDIEDELLLSKKRERTFNAYCWTLKPVFLEYVIKHFSNIKRVTYLDADLYFFNDMQSIFEENIHTSVLLSNHHYTKSLKKYEAICGKYNSGFISFKRDEKGLNALKWWKEKCLSWCSEVIEKERFGDQKYLDKMILLWDGVEEIKTIGVNIGFWNHGRYKTSIVKDKVYINNVPLIFYHFAGFRILNEQEFAIIVGFRNEFIDHIYLPYMKKIQKSIEIVKNISPHFPKYFHDKSLLQGVTIYTIS